MALTKYRLGELIQPCNEQNIDGKYSLKDVKGISIQKTFIETKADMEGVSLRPYVLLKPDYFAYVPTTSRNGNKITIAHNTSLETYIVSSSYIVFSISRKDLLLSDYLFMYFNRPEFDRFSRFHSWGSARETFDWDTLCDMEMELPNIKIQQKYVNIYNAMIANQRAYEKGLDDLKLVCDGYIENLRRNMPCEKIGKYLNEVAERNENSTIRLVKGVESSGQFVKTRANMQDVKIDNYTIVRRNNIAYNPSRINLGSIALYRDDMPCVVSPMYEVFEINDTSTISPDYLMLWLQRKEFFRYTWFYAQGSVRDTFDLNLIREVAIPIPDVKVQQAIVNIYNQYATRKEINEKLKTQIKNICPILINGAMCECQVKEEIWD